MLYNKIAKYKNENLSGNCYEQIYKFQITYDRSKGYSDFNLKTNTQIFTFFLQNIQM